MEAIDVIGDTYCFGAVVLTYGNSEPRIYKHNVNRGFVTHLKCHRNRIGIFELQYLRDLDREGS
jgi:hypothetical protein